MQEIIEGVEKLANEELERANVKFKMFHSTHEGYAILKEEIEEVEFEMDRVKKAEERMWRHIKLNKLIPNDIDILKRVATNAAAESIQVIAMCNKFIESEVLK